MTVVRVVSGFMNVVGRIGFMNVEGSVRLQPDRGNRCVT